MNFMKRLNWYAVCKSEIVLRDLCEEILETRKTDRNRAAVMLKYVKWAKEYQQGL